MFPWLNASFIRRAIIRTAVYLLATPMLLACGNAGSGASSTVSGNQPCTMVLAYGLSLNISVPTGDPTPDLNQFSVTISDGSYRADWTPGSGGIVGYLQSQRAVFLAAPERAGTYRIEVGYPGYAPVAIDGVSVTSGSCHVSTQTVPIALGH